MNRVRRLQLFGAAGLVAIGVAGYVLGGRPRPVNPLYIGDLTGDGKDDLIFSRVSSLELGQHTLEFRDNSEVEFRPDGPYVRLAERLPFASAYLAPRERLSVLMSYDMNGDSHDDLLVAVAGKEDLAADGALHVSDLRISLENGAVTIQTDSQESRYLGYLGDGAGGFTRTEAGR